MEQFSLDKWLKDKSRKVVTRDGRKVRIICWYAKNSKPIVALVLTRSISRREFDELIVSYFNDGTYYGRATEDFLDLFFADEELEMEPETIEIPFGAKDSEFISGTYTIPEGCEARIDVNKVIIKRVQKEEELTEFEQELRYWIGQSLCNYENNGCVSDNMSDSVNIYLKAASKKLLDLARKELEKDIEHSAVEFAKSYMEDVNPSFEKVKESEELWKWKMSCLKGVNKAYTNGKQDALKDIPKWKKVDSNPAKFQYNLQGTRLYKDGEYYIELSDLETLPKEE